MAASDVLRMLANSDTKLSDALRAASILPEVINDPELAEWVQQQLTGYPDDTDLPDYRIRRFPVKGNATNGAWLHRGMNVPLAGFSDEIRDVLEHPRHLRQSVGAYESLLADTNGNVRIPFGTEGVGLMNHEIAQDRTAIDDSYGFHDVWWEVDRTALHEILDATRHHALTEIAKRVAPDQLEAKIADGLPSVPGGLSVTGSNNQVIVASPGATTTLTLAQGDAVALDQALAAMGIQEERIDELHTLIDDPDADEPTKVMRVLDWPRQAAVAIGINTAGSAAATLGLQYLGHLL